MTSEWISKKFGELINGKVRNGIYKSKDFHGKGIKIVNMGELFSNPRLSTSIEMKLLDVNKDEIDRFRIKKGDLIFARRSLTAEGAGKCIWVKEAEDEAVFESSLIRARANDNISDSQYLYYYFNSPAGKTNLGSILRQVAVSGITGSDLMELDIPLPPLEIQRQIANILSAFDDKIELNRQINRTLEQMARALFKSWFIDFDPVHAKQRGEQPAGMDAETAALIPDRFVEIDGKWFPESWRVSQLGSIVENPRRSINPQSIDGGTPYIGLEHMPRGSIGLNSWGKAKDVDSGKVIFKKGEILFGKLRPYFKKTGIAPFNGISSTDILILKPKINWEEYVLFLVSSDEFINAMAGSSSGTRMPRASWNDLAAYPIILPSAALAVAYSAAVAPIIEKIQLCTFESIELAHIRDTLLPRLLSGELDVSDWENAVEAPEGAPA